MFTQVQQGAAVWEGGLGCEHCKVRLACDYPMGISVIHVALAASSH